MRRFFNTIILLLITAMIFIDVPLHRVLDEVQDNIRLTHEKTLDDTVVGISERDEVPYDVAVNASAIGDFSSSFQTHVDALYMLDLNNNSIMYEMNADERLPMASLTKVMTYIIAFENIPGIVGEIFEVGDSVNRILSGTGSSVAGLISGEILTGIELLYMLMLPSGNDVSLVLSQHVDAAAGQTSDAISNYSEYAYDMGDSEFIRLMNEKAVELGCQNTNFTNSHGLHHENHYTTASDMAKIAQYALALPMFKEIVSSPTYTLRATNMRSVEKTFENTNSLLAQDRYGGMYYYEYAQGIKTGYHSNAGLCLSSFATKDEYSYLVIALGWPVYDSNGNRAIIRGELVDTINLYNWAFDSFNERVIVPAGYPLTDVSVQGAKDTEALMLVSDRDISQFLHKDIEVSDIEISIELYDSVHAPVFEGDIIGEAHYYYDGVLIGKSNAVAADTVYEIQTIFQVENVIDMLLFPLSSFVTTK